MNNQFLCTSNSQPTSGSGYFETKSQLAEECGFGPTFAYVPCLVEARNSFP